MADKTKTTHRTFADASREYINFGRYTSSPSDFSIEHITLGAVLRIAVALERIADSVDPVIRRERIKQERSNAKMLADIVERHACVEKLTAQNGWMRDVARRYFRGRVAACGNDPKLSRKLENALTREWFKYCVHRRTWGRVHARERRRELAKSNLRKRIPEYIQGIGPVLRKKWFSSS